MTTLKLPGLIDVHTHLRYPGQTHKEDFASGTAAALAGGVTMVLAMPNTNPPISTVAVMKDAHAAIARDAVCDVGVYAGASSADIAELPAIAPLAAGLKIYLNDTFGKLRVDAVPTLARCFQDWPRDMPIAMHAEKQSVAVGIGLSATYDRPVHFCHISRKEEIELIADAKARGLKVTCEVCPHHLFMGEADFHRMGPLADMRPVLGAPDDVAALWEHLIGGTVDIVATDHAPHTLEEKRSDNVPPGIVGLETSLVLMLGAVVDGRITQERLVDLMHHAPKRIFGLPDQPDTEIEVDMSQPHIIRNADLKTRVGWTPFDGREVVGRVSKVTLRGETVLENGAILAQPGTGKIVH